MLFLLHLIFGVALFVYVIILLEQRKIFSPCSRNSKSVLAFIAVFSGNVQSFSQFVLCSDGTYTNIAFYEAS